MSDPVLPWFKMYPREALSDSDFVSWSLQERGAWVTLIMHNWIEGSLPESLDALGRLLGVPRNELSGIWTVLGRKFIPHPDYPGRITSPRLETERAKAIAQFEKRSEAATKAITARWSKEKAKHTRRIRNEYASDTDAIRLDTKPAYQPQPQDQPQDQIENQPTTSSGLAGESLLMRSLRERLTADLGLPALIHAGSVETQSFMQAQLDAVGVECLLADCRSIAAMSQSGTPSSMNFFPGWLRRLPIRKVQP